MPLQVTNPSANVIEVFFQYTSEPKLVRVCLYSHFAYMALADYAGIILSIMVAK